MEPVIDIKKCTCESIGIEITGKDAPSLVAAINKYLEVFAEPISSGDNSGSMIFGSVRCLRCGSMLDGAFGTFKWGMVHGEGFCSECSWPARAYHVPEDDDGKIFDQPLQRILQYHPDGLVKSTSVRKQQVRSTIDIKVEEEEQCQPKTN